MNKKQLLAKLSYAAAGRASTMAYNLAEFQKANRFDDATLLTILRCDIDGLRRLRLCRAIDIDQADFRDRVKKVSLYSGCDQDRLVWVLRWVASVVAMRDQHQHDDSGIQAMMAARRKVNQDNSGLSKQQGDE